MSFNPPTSSDSQAYDSAQDADRVELIGSAVVSGTVDQGTGGLSAWLVSINGVPHVIIDSGSVAVSNLPATQPVSGAVSVSNFPATQPVSGTVTATGPLTDTQLRATAVPVSISAGAAVIGHVIVDSGSVSVSNVPHVIVDSGTFAALTDGTQRVGGTERRFLDPGCVPGNTGRGAGAVGDEQRGELRRRSDRSSRRHPHARLRHDPGRAFGRVRDRVGRSTALSVSAGKQTLCADSYRRAS